MSQEPKFKINDNVVLGFPGKIVSVSVDNSKGKIEYKVSDGKGNSAYCYEECLAINHGIITCLICGQSLDIDAFQEHMFVKGELVDSHRPPPGFSVLKDACIFCGGRIHTSHIGEDSYYSQCTKCQFLWDED